MYYKLKLPPILMKMHNVFHVSLLNKYVHDPTHVLNLDKIEMSYPLAIEVRTIRVLETRVKTLRGREIE